MPVWEIARVLPNLSLPARNSDAWASSSAETGRATLSLRSPWIEIMPGDDPRLQPYTARSRSSRVLLAAFRDYDGSRMVPSVLAVRDDAPIKRELDSIASFRNAAAACFALRARAAIAAEANGRDGAFTDTFDFHPAEVDKRDRVQIHSAAMANFLGRPTRLSFAPTPSAHRALDLRFCDVTLSRLLSKAWRAAYLQRRRRRLLLPLFRSLEVAYQAGAIPQKNVGSLYDFGLTIAHWVSALESLLWLVSRKANQHLSLSFIGRIEVSDRGLAARRFRVRNDKTLRLNALQKACSLIYLARNRFLHGDPFRRSHLVPWPKREVRLPELAAVVYREALKQRLHDIFQPVAPTIASLDGETIAGWFQEDVYDEALRKIFGRERQPPR